VHYLNVTSIRRTPCSPSSAHACPRTAGRAAAAEADPGTDSMNLHFGRKTFTTNFYTQILYTMSSKNISDKFLHANFGHNIPQEQKIYIYLSIMGNILGFKGIKSN
jgi:hypothetical protein